MKNIIFIRSNSVDPDPRVEKEVNALEKNGFKVSILAWDRDVSKEKSTEYFLNNSKVRINYISIKSLYGIGFKKNLVPLLSFQIKELVYLIKHRDKYDIIHACDFDTILPAVLIAKIFRKKIIYDIFDYYVDAFSVPNILKNFIKKIDNTIISIVDGVILCTEMRLNQIKGSNPKKICIIHNSPKELVGEDNKEKISLNKEKIKLVYVGILSKDRFLKEIVDIVAQNENYELYIGGFGILEEEIKIASSKSKNIIYYGKLDYQTTVQLEKACDIMFAIYDPAVPNHYYAAPNKFYESLMLGKPIIMAKNTGMSDIINEYKIGEVIDFNKKDLENALLKISSRKNKWAEISQRGQLLYKEKYSWEKMELRLYELYREIIKGS
ncbi:MAG: glycosyltransferase family 4 protein [Sarcina sp.]